MKTEILHKKLERYVNGESMPAETRQIQTWLSCTTSDYELSAIEKAKLETDILKEIQEQTAYPLFYPKQEKPWWQKITAMF
ncbi:MAG: hypothetical protein J7527_14240 [Chitinophagaceae bacterium]|nr:hypothetical protein [Chitinophagaceae bacterium]